MTAELLGARRVRALLDSYGVHPAKALGQNFVIDPNTIRKIVHLAELQPDDLVLEIGAGVGSLTVELARVASHVVAVEIDPRLARALAEVLDGVPNVTVLEGDALEVDLASLDASRLVANLPYNVAATVVLRVLEEAPGVERLTVMTQREVGERLAAPPGSKTYGLTSALLAYWGSARVAASVSRRAFYPEPNVDSVVVVVERAKALPDVDRTALFALVRAAFGQRRKMLRSSLAALAGSASAAESALLSAGLDPTARPEEVGIAEFVALTRALRRRDPAL